MKNNKKVTIDKAGHDTVVRDENGTILDRRSRYCNPTMIYQIIADTERNGWIIDWEKSQVVNPEAEVE